MKSKPISPKDAFERDGFAILPGFFLSNEIKDIEHAVENFIYEQIHKLPPQHVFYEDKNNKSTLKQIQHLHEHSEFFHDLINDKPRQLAAKLLGEEVEPKNLQYFNKTHRTGKATPPHQDGYYFMLKPCSAITIWLALDVADEENGCVRYLPKSHTHGLRPHVRTQVLGFSQCIDNYNSETDEVSCPALPGDVLAHHALTIHRAKENNSPTRNRRALGFVFYGLSANEDKQAHESYQRKLRSELVESGRI